MTDIFIFIFILVYTKFSNRNQHISICLELIVKKVKKNSVALVFLVFLINIWPCFHVSCTNFNGHFIIISWNIQVFHSHVVQYIILTKTRKLMWNVTICRNNYFIDILMMINRKFYMFNTIIQRHFIQVFKKYIFYKLIISHNGE